MIHPTKIDHKLGFDQVRNLLKKLCSGPGQDIAEVLEPSFTHEEVAARLQLSREVIDITVQGLRFPEGRYLDLSSNVNRLRTAGTYLEGKELRELADLLHFSSSWYRFFKKYHEEFPALTAKAIKLHNFGALVRQINDIVDRAGNIKDNASPELLRIRNQLNEEQQHLRKALDKTMRWGLNEGYIAEDMTITVRNGRMVIPVKAEYKRQIKGFIHDESSTGQIVFLEPQNALESNNRIKELDFEEKREVTRILMKISGEITNYLTAILEANDYLREMDFLLAVAKFSRQVQAVIPGINQSGKTRISGGKHVGLMLNLAEQGKNVVPLSVDFDEDKRILVISGPNAGGKSVALKTIGLLQYMLQMGLPVPVDGHSSFQVFEHFLVDIGDEQSIESDLSTYSSHLTNMRRFITIANARTLFLIDEFGSGTEPEMGGAIAAAILETLHDSKATGVITTHYGILKEMAHDFGGLINGAMRFDADRLLPLFELELGVPGSSYALEVAEATNIDRSVLEKARKYINPEKVALNELIVDLEKQRNAFKNKLEDARKKEAELKTELEKYRQLYDDLNRQKKEFINNAKAEAQQLLNTANKKIEKTIRVIRENQADKEKTREVREELKNFSQHVKIKKPKTAKPQKIGGKIAENDFVILDDGNTTGQVISIKGKEAVVSFGELKTTVKTDRLQKVGAPSKTAGQPPKKSAGVDIARRKSSFARELDVRGKLPSEALEILRNKIDEAILVGADDMRIVHGKGTGILRDVIRKELKTYPQVSSVLDENPDAGGDGVTLVTF